MNILLASREHEPGLRALARAMPMPGWIRMTFEREPDYFHGLAVQGRLNQVIVSVEDGRVIAAGCRSVLPVYVNGEPTEFGYLHGMRSLPCGRQVGTVARGFRLLKELHGDGRVRGYVTTVIEGNKAAERILLGGRAGLPQYLDAGAFVTYAIGPGVGWRGAFPRTRGSEPASLEIRRGSDVPPAELIAFLNREGRRRQFFPVLAEEDFGSDRLRGLKREDVAVAFRAGVVVGAVACWDQSAFKQTVVAGYARPLALARPAANVFLRLAGFPALPRAGAALKMRYLSLVAVADDDPAVLAALIEHLRAEQRGERDEPKDSKGRPLLIIGFHERDPLNRAMASFAAFRYRSRLYLVGWDEEQEYCRSLINGRVPYLEPAML